MKKSLYFLSHLLIAAVLLGIGTGRLHARIVGTTGAAETCWGASGVEVCVDVSGNWIPTTTAIGSLGTSALKWKDLYLSGNATVGGTLTQAGSFIKTPVTAQVIGAGGTISTVGACGGLIKVSVTANRTTDTTNTLTAPTAGNEGCRVDIVNTGGGILTLDNNANFLYSGSNDLALGTNDAAIVEQVGLFWTVIGTRDN